jgi:hypothetical protein
VRKDQQLRTHIALRCPTAQVVAFTRRSKSSELFDPRNAEWFGPARERLRNAQSALAEEQRGD